VSAAMRQVHACQSDPTTQQARRWLAARPVFLDTETTGLDAVAEICEIALISHAGTILLDTLVRPRRPIPPEATAVHGIADADVAGAPSLPDIWEDLVFLVTINALVIYSVFFLNSFHNRSMQVEVGGIRRQEHELEARGLGVRQSSERKLTLRASRRPPRGRAGGACHLRQRPRPAGTSIAQHVDVEGG